MAPFGDLLANLKGKGKNETSDLGPSAEDSAAQILAEAEREIATLRSATEAKCAAVTEQYGKEATEAYWKAVAAGRGAADQKAGQMVNLATMEAKKHVLALKQELTGQTFDLALQRLTELPEDQYTALLASLVLRAVRTGREQLIFSPRDREVCGKRVTIQANEALSAMGKEARLTMGEETRDMAGGVIIVDGQVETNCSLETLVAFSRRTLTGPVAQMLFES